MNRPAVEAVLLPKPELRLVTLTVPASTVTLPTKVFAPAKVTVPVPFFVTLPGPLMIPERVAAGDPVTVRSLVSEISLLIVRMGVLVPVAAMFRTGVAAPSLMNSREFPEIVTVGLVAPLLGPA